MILDRAGFKKKTADGSSAGNGEQRPGSTHADDGPSRLVVQRDTRGPSSRCRSGSGVRPRRIQFSSQIDEDNIARRGAYAAGESGTHRGISISH